MKEQIPGAQSITESQAPTGTRTPPTGAGQSPRRFAGQELGFAWGVAAVLGALAISLSSGVQPARLFIPVVIMVFYLMYGWRLDTKNTAKLADSVYFLGFLWTLYALIDALVFRRGQIKADQVFVVFGYALVTTACGMFLRLLVLQFQRTLPDQIVEARDEIDQRVRAFTEEL